MNRKLPDVDIIIVNYNGLEYIPACLESLFKTDYPSFTVMVVDNGSRDGSVKWIQKNYPRVKTILNNKNLGFGKATNIGLRVAGSSLIAFLNSDTVVEKDWLRPLVEALGEDSSVAATCSKLLFMKHPRVLNGVGGGMNYVGYGYDIGIYEIDNGQFSEKQDVFFPCAAACVLKKSVFEEIGGFDEKFFMYHEDVDLGWRMRLKGHGIKCVPDSVVYHAFGGASPKSGNLVFRNNLGQRHALRSLIKNYEFISLLKVLPLFIGLGLKNTLRERSLDFIRSILWNVKVLADTLKKRKGIQKGRKIRDKEFSSLIWQGMRLPVQFPDYSLLDLESFLKTKNRRPLVEISHDRWEHLGYGWYGREVYFGDGRTRYRWSKDEAVFYLWNKYGHGIVYIEVLGLFETLKQPREFSVSINDDPPHEFVIKSDHWETISVPYDGQVGPLEVKIKARDTWCPNDYFKNGDERSLGVGFKGAEFIPKHIREVALNGVSVIIPTYNRAQKLLRVLSALEAQTLDKAHFEVIVVDDGSTDSTSSDLEGFVGNAPLQIRYLRQTNKKQGAARNLGIKHSRMPLLTFIGDDIIPEPNFLEEHLYFHRKNNRYGNVAVIGYTTWEKDIKVTPFMRYIGEYGHQFGYSLIEGNGPLTFNFFYTSNISMPRAMLENLEYLFEEDFDTYGWEDIELGYRLESMGMRLLYNPKAVAYHDHPVDIHSFCRRQFMVGNTSRIFLRKHPELEWFLGSSRDVEKWARLGFLSGVIERAEGFLDKRLLLSLPHALYSLVLKANYGMGAIIAGS